MARFTYRPPSLIAFRQRLLRYGGGLFGLAIPVAEFTTFIKGGGFGAKPTQAPGFVRFIDQSTGAIDTWFWDFGDGNTSTDQNPGHTYLNPGSYTVSLTVCNTAGCDTETKISFIVLSLTGSVSIWRLNDDPLLGASIRYGLGPNATFVPRINVSGRIKRGDKTSVKINRLRDRPRVSAKLRSLDA